jgi:hypothetical protein
MSAKNKVTKGPQNQHYIIGVRMFHVPTTTEVMTRYERCSPSPVAALEEIAELLRELGSLDNLTPTSVEPDVMGDALCRSWKNHANLVEACVILAPSSAASARANKFKN